MGDVVYLVLSAIEGIKEWLLKPVKEHTKK
jgi:hypothetical protein